MTHEEQEHRLARLEERLNNLSNRVEDVVATLAKHVAGLESLRTDPVEAGFLRFRSKARRLEEQRSSP